MKLLALNIIVISFLGFGLTSCSVITNDSVSAGDKPIVEGYLVAGQPVSIALTKEIPYSVTDSVSATPIDNLSLKVTDDLGTVYLLTNVGKGVYKSAANQVVKVGRSYTLNFTYNGRSISANTSIPTKPQNFVEDKTSIIRTQINLAVGGSYTQDDNTPVYLSWANTTNDYYFVVVDNIETNPSPIVIYPATTDGTAIQSFVRRFRNQPVQGTGDQIRAQSFQYFGKHRLILFHINPDYAALYQSSGTTTQNISTPPSAIANGLGIFTGVNSDTLQFTVNKR